MFSEFFLCNCWVWPVINIYLTLTKKKCHQFNIISRQHMSGMQSEKINSLEISMKKSVQRKRQRALTRFLQLSHSPSLYLTSPSLPDEEPIRKLAWNWGSNPLPQSSSLKMYPLPCQTDHNLEDIDSQFR